MTYTIYRVTDLETNEHYIGATTSMVKASAEHFQSTARDWHRKLRRYPSHFDWSAIEVEVPEECVKERWLENIIKYDSFWNGNNETLYLEIK